MADSPVAVRFPIRLPLCGMCQDGKTEAVWELQARDGTLLGKYCEAHAKAKEAALAKAWKP